MLWPTTPSRADVIKLLNNVTLGTQKAQLGTLIGQLLDASGSTEDVSALQQEIEDLKTRVAALEKPGG